MNRRTGVYGLTLPLLLAGCGGKSATVRFRVIAMVTIDGQPHEGSRIQRSIYSVEPHDMTD